MPFPIALASCLLATSLASGADAPLARSGDGKAAFIRGETDGFPGLGLGDVIAVLETSHMGRLLPCLDAADTNDDGFVSIADAIFLLDLLFRGGAQPPAPSGACGFDPTPDGLWCNPAAPCRGEAAPARRAGFGPDAPAAGPPGALATPEPASQEVTRGDEQQVSASLVGRESRALPGGARGALRGAGGALIAIGEVVSGEITTLSQVDAYTFEATRGQWITADRLATSNSLGLNWSIEDSWGRVVASGPTSFNDLGPLGLLGGLYTVRIVPDGTGAGTYQFRIVDSTPEERSIAIGEKVQGSIDADHPGQRQHYLFTADPGQIVYLQLLSTGSTPLLNWELQDSRGRVVLSSRRIDDEGPLALLGGEYRLTVEGTVSSGNLQSGAYEFSFTEVPAPVTRALVLGQTTAGNLSAAGAEELWTFTATPGQVIFLDAISSANGAAINWEMTDRAGRTILERTGNFSDEGPFKLAGGGYTVRVLGEGEFAGAYSFRAVDATPPRTSIAIGVEVAGEIPADRPGQSVVYDFTSPSARLLTIELVSSSNSGSLDWMLEDNLGRTVLARTNSLATVGPIPLLGGAYRLHVLPEADRTGTFRFRLRDDGPASAAPTGSPAAIGDVVESAIAAPGGQSRFTFTAPAGKSVYLDLLQGNSSLDWDLVDALGAVLDTNAASSTDSGDLGPFPLTAGDYTVVLRARTPTAAPAFRFQIADAAPVVKDAALGDVVEGEFAGAPGAVHTYRFTVPASAGGETSNVFLDKLIVSTRLEWTLLDAMGTAVFAKVRADSADDDEGPFPLFPGSYSLVLDPQYGYTPAYRIALRTVVDTETAFAVGDVIAGNFTGSPGSKRTFLLDASEGQRVYFDGRPGTPRLDWKLLDPAGSTIFGPERMDSGSVDEGPLTLGAGTYRFILDPQAGFEPRYEIQVVAVTDIASPLVLGTPVSGALGTGATASYSFHAFEGERIFFDLAAGASPLRWSLFDEMGESVFQDVQALSDSTDMGPLNLAAGTYRLVFYATGTNAPSYSFTVSSLAVDLGVADLAASPRVVFQADQRRELDVSWDVVNRGGGPAPTGPWVDQLVVSKDTTPGNADDIIVGEFARFDTLEPRSSYSRRETVRLPADLAIGQYRLYLLVDAGGAHSEPGGEADNIAGIEIEVVEDLPPAEPDFITAVTFPIDFTADSDGDFYDVPLSRPVSLDSIRFVHAEALTLGITGGASVDVTMNLLSGRDQVLEVATVGAFTGRGGNFVIRFSRRLSPQTVALLPVRTVDAVRFRFGQPSKIRSVIESIHRDDRLRVYFAGCEFSPCGPHLERRVPGAEGITLDTGSTSEWKAVNFDEAVPGDGLRFVSGPVFSATLSVGPFTTGTATSEVQLILDDGRLVTLDDSRAPSTLGASAVGLSHSHSLGFNGEELAGRRVLGLQWRVHKSGFGASTAIYEPLDDLALRFLYEVEACRGSVAIPPVELEPADGASFPPGSRVTISGRALAPQQGRPLSAVLVNGEAVESLDAAGRFFKTVQVAEGDNLFVVSVVEPGCGEYESLLKLRGLTGGSSGLEGYAEVTSRLSAEYADTTFTRTTGSLVVRVRARNTSEHRVRGPILLVVTGISSPSVLLRGPSVSLRAPSGLTSEGEPFVVVLEDGELGPGDAGPYVPLIFENQDRVPVRFGVRWLAPADRPPYFSSTPPVSAVIGKPYRYAPSADDPDGDSVQIELERGPAGMALDPAGVLTWTPAAADAGVHDVVLAADDGQGGRATQRWSLTVSATSPNRSPYFTTVPITSAPVGARYLYEAGASDPEGDPVSFRLLAGPAGLGVEPGNGRVTWDFAAPGEHAVSLEAADESGGAAVQAFLLAVGSLPSNPSAPRLTTSPGASARPGVLYIYQPVASDPDGDALQFSLEGAPAGMTIDPARGRIQWTPGTDQSGAHTVTLVVKDGRGGETRQTFSIEVGEAEGNLPPVVESVPGAFALAGQTYRYQVVAIDPDGDSIRFSLVEGPTGMSLAETTGLLGWTPVAGDAGTHVVAVRATDPAGAAGNQAFELRVRASNAAPAVTSGTPSLQVIAGATFQHDVDAGDADGDLLRYLLGTGPAGMTVHAVTGLVTWKPSPADVGTHPVTVRIEDCCGGSAEVVFVLEVLADVTPPSVAIGFDPSPAGVGAIVEVFLSASDDVSVATKKLTVECAPDAPREVALDSFGRAIFASTKPGFCIFEAVVTDPSRNSAKATQVLQVGNPDDPLDPYPPVVTVLEPAPGSVITALANVVASISDDTADGEPGAGPVTWKVEIAAAGSDAFEQIGAGSGEVTNALLASLDPTMRPNGIYKLRITGSDTVQTGGIEYEISIAGELKLGNFRLDFVDLAIPLAGLPMVVARRYDSLDTSQGDFGAGWTLGLPGDVEDGAKESTTGNGLVDLLASEPFKPGTRVYVTLPDGRRAGFTFEPRALGGFLAFLHVPYLAPDDGVNDRLEVVQPGGDVFVFGGKANQLGVPYNPTVYRLTTKEGVSYTIDETSGLQSIEDIRGNTIDVRADGLSSSTGTAISFQRDAEGRITRITEPDADPGDGSPPGHLDYAYDGSGNLVAFTNQNGDAVRYFYENAAFPHYLTRIEDPLGRPLIRNAYDEEGRLVALCGPGGNPTTLEGCTEISRDASARTSTILDPCGFRADFIYDERGNLLRERRFLNETEFVETVREYDGNDRLVREISPGGETWTSAYDDAGNVIATTDPSGRTWTTTYNSCNLVETETDPAGAVTRHTYDDHCNRITWTDSLGNVTRYEYDADNRPTVLTDAVGNRWQYRYDSIGVLKEIVNPGGGVTTLVVNRLGQVVSNTDAEGRKVDLVYDSGHRVVQETWNTVPARVISYEYDASGHLVLAADPDSELQVEYHHTGRIKRVESSGPPGSPANWVEYEYNANGKVTLVTAASQTVRIARRGSLAPRRGR